MTPALEQAPVIPNGLIDTSLLAPLARLALPTVAVMFLVTTLSVAETYFVSTLGTDAVAAASLVVPVALLITMVSNGGIGGGVSSAIARARGAGDQVAAESLLWHTLVLGVLFGIATTILIWLFGPWLYRALGGRDAGLAGAVAYSNVLFGGSAASWSLMLLQAALRGAGNVKVPALAVAGSVAAGLLLSPPLITGAWGWPGMGVVGAGVAQVITTLGGLVGLIVYLRRPDSTLKLKPQPLSRARFADILRIGIPSSLNAVLSALALTAATAAAGAYGATALAGYGIASRLDSLLVPVLFGFGTAAIALVGMALGAGDVARARRAAITNAVFVATALEGLGLIVAVWPTLWLAPFTSDPAVIVAGSDYLRIIGPTFGLTAIGMELYFAGQGARTIFWPMIATVMRLAVVLIAVALTQMRIIDLHGAFAIIAAGIAVSAAVTLGGFFFRSLARDGAAMNPQALPFLVGTAFGLVAWGLVVRRYVWPWAQRHALREAAEPILYLHTFRFIGLGFIAPGVVSPDLNAAWASGAAWGDVGAAVLALVSLAIRKTRAFPLLLWVFNLWGSFDLLRAAALGPVYDVPPHLQATFFIPVLGVPLLLWTHVVIFALLLRKPAGAVS